MKSNLLNLIKFNYLRTFKLTRLLNYHLKLLKTLKPIKKLILIIIIFTQLIKCKVNLFKFSYLKEL